MILFLMQNYTEFFSRNLHSVRLFSFWPPHSNGHSGPLYLWTNLSKFVKSPFWRYISATKHPGSLNTLLNKSKCPFKLKLSRHKCSKPSWQGVRPPPPKKKKLPEKLRRYAPTKGNQENTDSYIDRQSQTEAATGSRRQSICIQFSKRKNYIYW